MRRHFAAPISPMRLLPLAVTALLGVLHLPFPFTSDQALTLVGARALNGGATLYLDWWDIRQPGGVWFDWLAGRLFGFSELGVHLLETLWMGGAALVILVVARHLVSRAQLVALAPLVSIGMYYAWASPFVLSEAEGLAMLPLSLCLLAVLKDAAGASPRSVVALWTLFGVAAAGSALLKSVFLIIPAALAAAVLVRAIRTRRVGLTELMKLRLLPAAGGALAPIAAVSWHFWTRGALDELGWTLLTAPVLHLAEIPRAPYQGLLRASARYLAPWLPAVPLWWMAVRRPRTSAGIHLLATWIAAATAVILIQRYYYGPYHFLLLTVPLGLLVLCGAEAALDALAIRGESQARATALLVLPLLLAAAAPVGPKLLALRVARAGPGSFGDAYRRILWPAYVPALQAAAAVSQEAARPGAAFVFGDPLILLYSGRAQSIPLRGSSLAFMLQQHWDAFPALLEKARTPYIYVGREVAAGVRSRSPGVFELLDARYRVLWDGEPGIWYELAPARPDPAKLSFPSVP